MDDPYFLKREPKERVNALLRKVDLQRPIVEFVYDIIKWIELAEKKDYKFVEQTIGLKHFISETNYIPDHIDRHWKGRTDKEIFYALLKSHVLRFLEDFNPETDKELERDGLDIKFDEYKDKGYCFTLIIKAKEEL